MSIIQLAVFSTSGPGTSAPVVGQDINKTFIYSGGDQNDVTAIEASGDGTNWARIVAATVGASWVAQVANAKYSFLRANRLNALSAAPVIFVAANDTNVISQFGPGGSVPFATVGMVSNWIQTASNTATAAAAWQMPPTAGGQQTGALQFEINVVYRATASGAGGSRKVTGTIRANAGSLLVDSQQNSQINDNAVFGSNITVALAVVASTAVVLNVTGLVTTSIDWTVSGVILQAY